jgi:hypothetical protein
VRKLLLSTLFISSVFASDVGSLQENFIDISIDSMALLFLIVAAFIAWDVYSNFKGGQLSVPWGFIAGGIVLFALGRLIQIGEGTLWILPPLLNSFVHLVVAIFLGIGLILYRKTIS